MLTSYLVANAIILPMTGWLASDLRPQAPADALGGRLHRVVVPVRARADPAAALIVFRVLQGATGGALQPLSQAVLLEAFPPQDRGKAMGFWGLGIVVAPILGPVLGGWLTDSLQLALGVLHQHPDRHRVDRDDEAVHLRPAVPASRRRAAASTTGASGCSSSASARCRSCSTRGSRKTGSPRPSSSSLAVISAVTLVALIVHELTTEHPIVDLRVFKERTYAVGVFLMTIVGFVLYGSMVLLPIMLQTLLGYPPLQAGIAHGAARHRFVRHDAADWHPDRQGSIRGSC